MYSVDLNSDLGESFGVYKLGQDEEILKYVTSANIACGFHAGDPSVMHKTVQMALLNKVAIGAHPGFQDLAGFGRRNMVITPMEAYDLMVYQISALQGFVKAEGGLMHHVKPHGALYNMSARDEKLAEAIAEAIYKVNPELILYGLSRSELIKAGNRIGIKTASEVFADRTYQIDATLTSRNQKDAVITNQEEAVFRISKMIKNKKVMCQQGKEIDIKADTICIHGDSSNALVFASKIRKSLEEAGIVVEKA